MLDRLAPVPAGKERQGSHSLDNLVDRVPLLKLTAGEQGAAAVSLQRESPNGRRAR
jgi:hypothetical protein